MHVPRSPYWVLHVDRPAVHDSGTYECQVSSTPKVYRRFQLDVVGELDRLGLAFLFLIVLALDVYHMSCILFFTSIYSFFSHFCYSYLKLEACDVTVT